jgi:hypothetical protein
MKHRHLAGAHPRAGVPRPRMLLRIWHMLGRGPQADRGCRTNILLEPRPERISGPMTDRDLARAIREIQNSPLVEHTAPKLKRSNIMDTTAERVRQRAYELWEQSGKPEGSDMDFWLQAEREIGDNAPPLDEVTPQG